MTYNALTVEVPGIAFGSPICCEAIVNGLSPTRKQSTWLVNALTTFLT